MPPQRHRAVQIAALIAALLVCFAVAGVGGASTVSSLNEWYPTLKKPSFNPPNWIFGPVWTVLYAMMAVAAWLVWRSDRWRETRSALGIFGLQLALNLGWSLIFFGLRQPGWAFAEIFALWVSIALTTVLFWKVKPVAGAMFLPYLAWVAFASLLNYEIWRLNP